MYSSKTVKPATSSMKPITMQVNILISVFIL